MDCSTSGFPILPHLPDFAQTHAHSVSDPIHPTIFSSVIPFSLHLQSFPASGPFPMSLLFPSRGQSIGASDSTSVLLMNIQDWFPLGLTGLISLQSKGLQRVFSNTTVQKHQFFSPQFSLWSKFCIYIWLLGKTIALTRWTIVTKIMPLLLNMLSRFVIAFFQWATIF